MSSLCFLETNMSTTHADSIFDLPQDIIFNILSRLPVKSLIQFRCVCTSSGPLISHPYFTKLYPTSTVAGENRTIISYDPFDENYFSLLSPLTFEETCKLKFPYELHTRQFQYRRCPGSSKGLICFFNSRYHSSYGTLILWNPSINKHKILDAPHYISGKISLYAFVFGFGFVSRTCEFKVVEIVYDCGANRKRTGGVNPVIDKNNIVLVYSLSTNSWEKKKGLSAPCYLNYDWLSTTVVNGFVNWLAYREDGSRAIMAFDLDNERFQVYDFPKDIVSIYHNLSMHSFGEEGSLSLSLSLCARYREFNDEKLDVWVMGEFGVADSWKKVSVVSHDLIPLLPLVMKNEREVLIVTRDGRLKLFDAIKNEMQDLGTLGRNNSLQAISYTASLALLDG